MIKRETERKRDGSFWLERGISDHHILFSKRKLSCDRSFYVDHGHNFCHWVHYGIILNLPNTGCLRLARNSLSLSLWLCLSSTFISHLTCTLFLFLNFLLLFPSNKSIYQYNNRHKATNMEMSRVCCDKALKRKELLLLLNIPPVLYIQK